MNCIKRSLLVSLLSAAALCAQIPNISPSDPVGPCSVGLWINQASGAVWVCNAGVWAKSGTPLNASLLTPLNTAPTGTGAVVLSTSPSVALPTFTDTTDTTKKVAWSISGATTGTTTTLAAGQAGNITVNLPINAGALTNSYFCGATSGNASCSNTATGGTARVIGGAATLASNSAVISGISPAFTSTATYSCVGNDVTTRANPVQVVQTSASSITITNTTGATDVIQYLCVGY